MAVCLWSLLLFLPVFSHPVLSFAKIFFPFLFFLHPLLLPSWFSFWDLFFFFCPLWLCTMYWQIRSWGGFPWVGFRSGPNMWTSVKGCTFFHHFPQHFLLPPPFSLSCQQWRTSSSSTQTPSLIPVFRQMWRRLNTWTAVMWGPQL